MNIQEIREKYPQYQDLSDQQLADSMHSKYYSDIPQQEFYQKVGFSLPQETAPQEVPRGTIGRAPRLVNQAFSMMGGMPLNQNFETARRALGAVGEAGRETLNIPHKLGAPIPELGNENSVYNALGYTPNAVDKFAASGLEFLPYAAVPGGIGARVAGMATKSPLLKAMTGSAASGTAYGATNAAPGERTKEALMGAGIGAISPIIGRGVEGVVKGTANFIGKSAIPGLVKKAKDIMKIKHPERVAQNAMNWSNTEAKALRLNEELAQKGGKFDASPYNKYLNDYIDKIKSYTPAKQEQYKNALEVAKEAKNWMPQNFEDVVLTSKNLNTYLKDIFAKRAGFQTADKFSKEFIDGLKKTLQSKVLYANRNKVDPKEFRSFYKDWKQAKASHPKSIGAKEMEELFINGMTGKTPASIYGKLDPRERQSFYGGMKEQPYLEAANKGMLQFGKVNPKGETILPHSGWGAIGKYGALPLTTMMAARYGFDMPWEKAAMVGAGTGFGIGATKAAISKMARPGMVNKMIEIAEKSSKTPGKKINYIAQTEEVQDVGKDRAEKAKQKAKEDKDYIMDLVVNTGRRGGK